MQGVCVFLSESLAGLATSDPEFYQYLRDNDHELLEFRDEEEEEEEDEGERYGTPCVEWWWGCVR